MSDPIFLTYPQIVALHRLVIERFGGIAGIRDTDLLEGAMNHPLQVYFYVQADLFEIAAAYAFHITQAQACFDGNKRTGVAAALLFLAVNGVSTDFDSMPLYEAMIAVAERKMGKTELADLFRQMCSQ